jgi:hypothetical protein
MTDAVIVAFVAILPATLSFVLGIVNRGTLTEVRVNTNGNLIAVRNQLAVMSAQHLKLIEVSSIAVGVLEEKAREQEHPTYRSTVQEPPIEVP